MPHNTRRGRRGPRGEDSVDPEAGGGGGVFGVDSQMSFDPERLFLGPVRAAGARRGRMYGRRFEGGRAGSSVCVCARARRRRRRRRTAV